MGTINSGKQTQITPMVKEVAKGISGEGIAAIIEISDYIKSMNITTNTEGPDFSRTADTILKENKYNGCNEAGVVFATLLRARGITTTFIQALNKDAVINYSANKPSLNGHVFLEVSLDEGKTKKIVNSTTGEITDTLPKNMIEGGRGLDAWDMGLRNGFADLQKMFEERHEQLKKTHVI